MLSSSSCISRKSKNNLQVKERNFPSYLMWAANQDVCGKNFIWTVQMRQDSTPLAGGQPNDIEFQKCHWEIINKIRNPTI